MGLFKKKIEFITAICPQCKGNLHVDASLTKAYCQYCGAQCIVENAPKSKVKKGNLETVIEFIERQQELRREEKREKEKADREYAEKQRAHMSKFWWVYILCFFTLIGLLLLIGILGKQGII